MPHKYILRFSLVILFLLALLLVPVYLLSKNAARSTPQQVQEQAALPDSALEAALTAQLQARYGADITLESRQGSLFTFRKTLTEPAEGSFLFQAAVNPQVSPSWKEELQEYPFEDNYPQELLRFLGDSFRCGMMSIRWKETGTGLSRQYTPVFVCHSRGAFSLESYCSNICDFIEYCMKQKDLADHPELFSDFVLAAGKRETVYPDVSLDAYDRTAFYNRLYAFADPFTLSAFAELEAELADRNTGETETDDLPAPSPENLDPDTQAYFLSLEPDCTFRTAQGREYRMTGTDRAAGSSYYILIGTDDQGHTCSFYNPDPYNGSGGTAKWLTFLDESLGFSCLTYSGGSYGSLYRTEDGGQRFTEIEYPSAMALLPDGTYYNPFTMPEKVYEEAGQLWMLAGQGPDGDYYGEEGYCSGLYRSEDRGKTWIYVGEIPATSAAASLP